VIGTHNWNPQRAVPLVAFHQNEDHKEEEVTLPHPSTVGRHNHSTQHAVDIQGEHGRNRLD